ncbi:DUF4288 domain-containing protein [Akkermansiaceae bacterium]|nr:DUF4288 domain-containing protein [Akkermansiaceae bacterium]
MTIYGAKTVTKFDRLKNDDGFSMFEERIVMLKALSQAHAIEAGEAEAISYAEKHQGEYLGWISIYEARESEATFSEPQEIYSIMRPNNLGLDDNDYLDRFYDTGEESTS